MKIPIDVVIATALALPEPLSMVWAYLVAGGRTPADATLVGRLFRWLDRMLAYRMQQVSWLAIDYLIVRGVIALWTSRGVSAPVAAVGTVAAVALTIALGFAFIVPYGFAIAPFCEHRPIHHDMERHFPAHRELEAVWRKIHAEFLAVTERRGALPTLADVLPDNGLAQLVPGGEGGGTAQWNVVLLRAAGRDVPANMQDFPTLQRLLDRPEILSAMFSILQPGVELRPHRGYFKGVLRYHLCLEVVEPELAWLAVGGQRYHWREGESVLFDDMYVHSAHNAGSKRRVVLFLDIVRRLPGPLWHLNRMVTYIGSLHPYPRLIERRGAVSKPGGATRS
jgi:beta-hydroxylase